MPKKNTTRASNLSSRLRNQLGKFFSFPVIALLVTGGCLFICALLAAHLTRAYTGDDIVVQQIVQSGIHNPHGLNAYLGDDNFALKIPIYMLFDLIAPANSRVKIFITVLFFAFVFYALFIAFLWLYGKRFGYLSSRKKVLLLILPLVCYIGLSAVPGNWANPSNLSWISNFMKLNLRNAELAMALLMIYGWVQLVEQRLRPRWSSVKGAILLALYFIGSGFFLYSDPYFLYVLGGGLALTIVILWLTNRASLRSLIFPFISILVSVAAMKLFAAAIPRLTGLHTTHVSGGMSTTAPTDLFANASNTFIAILKMFNSYPWSNDLTQSKAALGLHNLPLITNGFFAIISLVALIVAVTRLRSRFDTMRLTLVVVALTCFVIYAFSNNGESYISAPYTIMGVVCLLPLLSDFLIDLAQNKSTRRFCVVIVLTLCATTIVNLAANLTLIHEGIKDKVSPNAADYSVINAALENGVTKGYGSYWDATTQTYLSSGKVIELPTNCDTTVAFIPFLYNKNDVSIPATRTFYLTNKDGPGETYGYCGGKLALFGEPASIVVVDSSHTMYIYSYDIGSRIVN